MPKKNNFNIIYVARYHPQKNHELLFKSIAIFKVIIPENEM